MIIGLLFVLRLRCGCPQTGRRLVAFEKNPFLGHFLPTKKGLSFLKLEGCSRKNLIFTPHLLLHL
jgi:hypothetical protein